MIYKQYNKIPVAHFKRFARRGYSAFCVCRIVAISVLTVSTLSSATMAQDFSEVDIQGGALTEYEDDSGGTPTVLDEVQVVTSFSTICDGRPAKIVSVITSEEIAESAAQSPPDLLKLISSIDVRQRGAAGVQTDLGIDGGTHDQVTILINGVNISTPQTGHYSADWPVNLDDIDRIEILEGAASRIAGGSSLMGAINIITKKPRQAALSINAEGGSYGTVGTAASGSFTSRSFGHALSAGWKRSDGGTVNSDYNRVQAFYRGNFGSRIVDVDWQAGFSDMAYGANTFYSAAYPNQHDDVARYLVSASARTKTKVAVEAMAYFMLHTDHYQLVRNTSFGENHHRTDVTGARLKASTQWKLGTTSAGAEMRYEHLISTALGTPLAPEDQVKVSGTDSIYYTKGVSRTNINMYVEHNARFGPVDLSAGVIMAMNTGQDHKFRAYPGIDLAYQPTREWRVSASWSTAFRMPTFTDLYYKSVAIEGNRDLKPERMQSVQATAAWTPTAGQIKVNGFWHRGHDMIDWVMYSADDIYHSTSFDIDNLGFSVHGMLLLSQLLGNKQPLESVSLDYTQIHQNRRDDKPYFKSNYALEYLRHKFVANLNHRIVGALRARWSVRWVDRAGAYIDYVDAKPVGEAHPYSPYAVLDLRLDYTIKQWLLYVTANNLNNHRYYDFGNIPQPGLWVMAGVTWRL